MPNYDVHVLSGIITYPAAVLIGLLIKIYLKVPLELTSTAMILGYAFYVLGSDLPDLDHPDALIHRGAKPIVSVAVGSAVFLWASERVNLSPEWVSVVAAWGVGVIGALVGWYAFTWLMPHPRGVVHSILFATVYALLVFLLIEYGLKMSTGEALYVGLSAFLGYSLHLLLDGSLKIV